MPKPRVVKRVVQELEIDENNPTTWPDEKPKDVIIDAEDMAAEEAVRDLPLGERCVRLYRIKPQGGRPEYLDSLIPEDFTMENVAEKHGGGRYFAKWKYVDGKVKRYPFEIAGEPFPTMRERKAHHPTPPVDDYERDVPFIPQTQGQEGLSMIDMLKLMSDAEERAYRRIQMIMEMNRPAPSQQAPLETLISFFEKGMNVASQGQEFSSNPWLSIMKEFKEPLTKIVDTVQLAMRKPPGVVIPAAPIPPAVHAAPQVAAPHPQPAAENGEDMLIQVKAMLPALITAASKNSDPAIYVDFVLDQIPAKAYPGLREWLAKPDCLDQLCFLEPGIRYQQEWWIALRGGLIEALADAESSDAVRTVQPADTEQNSEPSAAGPSASRQSA